MRFAWLGLLMLLLPSSARAELTACLLTGSNSNGGPSIGCDELVPCASGDMCPDGLVCNTTSRLCLPECSTIVGCQLDEDCDSLRAGGTCELFAATGADVGIDGVCTAPELPIQYCNGAGDLSVDRFLSCHTLPFSDTLAPSWFDGDCDGDGCPNGGDLTPCVTGGFCGRPDAVAPVCPHRLVGVGPERCVFLPSETPSCATAHACAANTDCPEGFTCAEDGCKPAVCSALYSCRHVADCPSDTELGEPILCLPTTRLDPGLGRGDGFCLFETFALTADCADLTAAETCFYRDGVFSNDFYQGDCDVDGCPNGLDPNPCASASSEACRTEGVSPACDTPIPPARDAGVPFEDAATPDGGSVPFDASSFDAAVDERVTFGGGGGCVCAAGAARAPSALFASLLLLLPLRRAAMRRGAVRPRA